VTTTALMWTEAAPAPARTSLDLRSLAALALAASATGAGVRTARVLAGARRIAGIVQRARPIDRPDLSEALGRAAARLGARAQVRVSEEVSEPLLAGLRHPVVLLPAPLAASGGAETVALICAHEFAHLRRRDNLRLLAEEAVLGALWFNPLLPRLRAELRTAREQVCDALALQAEASAARRLYADVLVRTLRLRAGPELQSTFTGARRRTAMRLHALLHPAAPPHVRQRVVVASLAAGLLAAAAGGALALTHVAGEAAPPPPAKPRGGLHVTPEPAFLKRWDHASRRSGLREAEDVYTGGLELNGRAPADYTVFVDGRQAAPGEDLGAIGPVAAVQVRRRRPAWADQRRASSAWTSAPPKARRSSPPPVAPAQPATKSLAQERAELHLGHHRRRAGRPRPTSA
jgi:beta-lactamase regulating signal transducer with metallopeptidase domain